MVVAVVQVEVARVESSEAASCYDTAILCCRVRSWLEVVEVDVTIVSAVLPSNLVISCKSIVYNIRCSYS